MAFPEQIKQRAIELSRGRSAREVLRLLDREFPDELSLPDERTIRRWRKAEPAIHVDEEQERIKSSVSENWREHNEQLAGVANMLLANDLDRVIEGGTFTRIASSGEPIETRQVDYTLISGTDNAPYELTNEQLSNQLVQNIELTVHEYTEWFFYECFLPHLISELPEELKTKGFWDIVKEQPYQLIEVLRLVAARKTFKGTCPVCKDWQ